MTTTTRQKPTSAIKRPPLWLHQQYDGKLKEYQPDLLVTTDMFPDLKVGDLIDLYQPDSDCPVHVLLQVETLENRMQPGGIIR
jgi:hypothetical protein